MQRKENNARRAARGRSWLWAMACAGPFVLWLLHGVAPIEMSRLWWVAGASAWIVAVAVVADRLLREGQSMPSAFDRELHTDPLTGLVNRRGFEYFVVAAASQPLTDKSLSVVMFDIDHFKTINDSHGHAAGDQVLRVLGERWRSQLRKSDLLARLGGEEFCLVLADTPLEQAVHVAEKLRRVTAEAPITIQKAGTPFGLEVTVSCGVASVERAESSIDRLMESADAALYEAKAKGRDSVVSRLDAL